MPPPAKSSTDVPGPIGFRVPAVHSVLSRWRRKFGQFPPRPHHPLRFAPLSSPASSQSGHRASASSASASVVSSSSPPTECQLFSLTDELELDEVVPSTDGGNGTGNGNKQYPQHNHHDRPGMPIAVTKSAAPPALSLSRAQLCGALLAFLGALLLTVLVTFLLTRDALRHERDASEREAADALLRAESAKLVAPEGGGIGSLNAGPDVTRLRMLGRTGAHRSRGNDTSHVPHPFAEDGVDNNTVGDGGRTGEPMAEELRLSGELHPHWYNLTLRLYLPGFSAHYASDRNLTFEGDLVLKFGVNRTCRRIELNALKLRFPTTHNDGNLSSLYELERADDADEQKEEELTPKVTAVRVDEAREKVFFELDREMREGANYTLRIPYSGPIASKLSGLYLTTYTTLDGAHKCAAVTQMEPTDARRMVPSFDEPEFKAVFRLSVIHPEGSRAVSNAKELREQQSMDDEPGWVRTDFDNTLPMSSYLLALVVSDFEFVEGNTTRGTRFRIWSRKDALNLTSYALQAGIKVLEFYEQYYDIPFPLPKQDMMAFPDFAAGAMENWGLVTYREKYLLYSPDLYTAQQKQAVASVVAHELAHQWFGNLVTMRWWSDLWLNEGFATLMEYLGTDAISDAQFRMDDYFLVEALDAAFDRDSRATSHPLFFEIRKAEDVTEAFDSITYSKGASVLRMIRAVMGEQYFKKGLNIYLTRFKYRNAEHTDLWDALTEAVPDGMRDWKGNRFSVKQFARQWTEQTGYPVVQVHRLNDNQVELSQQRFRIDPESKEANKSAHHGGADPDPDPNWEVPMWWSLNGTTRPMKWLKDKTTLNATDQDVLVLNSQSWGFYRIHYTPEALDAIQQQLFRDHKNLSLAARTRVIDDTFTLAEAGYHPYEAALNLSRYLVDEAEYPPWEIALAGFSTIQNYFEDEPEAGPMRAYIKQIINAIFERELPHIGDQRDDEEHFFDNLLRQRIVQRMCTLRDDRCILAILNMYADQFVRPCQAAMAHHHNKRPKNGSASHDAASSVSASACSRVPVAFRTLAYCEGIHYGAERDWEFVLRLFRRETVQVEKERLMLALACSRDTHTLKRLLSMAADANNTVIRLQDKPSVFAHVSSRIIGKKIILDFFTDHWADIYEDFKDQQTLLRSIISSSIVGKSKRVIDQVEQFLRDNERTTKNLDVFKQRLEVLHSNLRWMERNFGPLADWFSRHSPPRSGEELFQSEVGPTPSPIV